METHKLIRWVAVAGGLVISSATAGAHDLRDLRDQQDFKARHAEFHSRPSTGAQHVEFHRHFEPITLSDVQRAYGSVDPKKAADAARVVKTAGLNPNAMTIEAFTGAGQAAGWMSKRSRNALFDPKSGVVKFLEDHITPAPEPSDHDAFHQQATGKHDALHKQFDATGADFNKQQDAAHGQFHANPFTPVQHDAFHQQQTHEREQLDDATLQQHVDFHLPALSDHAKLHPDADHTEFHQVMDPLHDQRHQMQAQRHDAFHAQPFTKEQHDAFHPLQDAAHQQFHDKLDPAHQAVHRTEDLK